MRRLLLRHCDTSFLQLMALGNAVPVQASKYDMLLLNMLLCNYVLTRSNEKFLV
jgi:hypothetical protein